MMLRVSSEKRNVAAKAMVFPNDHPSRIELVDAGTSIRIVSKYIGK
jgi:hypothetical protein